MTLSGIPKNYLQRIDRIKIFCNVSPNEFYSALLVLLVLVSLFKDKHVQEFFYTHRKGYFRRYLIENAGILQLDVQ